MKKNLFLCAIAALTVGLSGCSKDDVSNGGDGPDDVTAGAEATVVLNLSFPQTYAVDGNATTQETAVKNVDIFVINPSNGAIITHKNLVTGDADLDDQTDNKWKATVKTTSGEKQILVGVNLPNSIRSAVAQGGLAGANENTVHTLTYGLLNDATEGFAMFSTEVLEHELYSDDDIANDNTLNNNLSIQVERMVAKVAVTAASVDASAVTDGTFTGTYEFTLGKVNKKTYAMQYTDALGVIRDPNYLSSDYNDPSGFDNSDFFNPLDDPTGYAVTDGTVFKYAPENVADLALKGTNTYVSVKAEFIPANFSDATGTETPNSNSSPVSFWTVTRGDDVKYFDDEDVADQYITNGGGSKSAEYENGVCYYNSYLSYNNGYNVLRNYYYKVTVTKILSLGSPDPDVDDDEEEEPIDGDFAMIDVDIDIVPWTVVNEDDHQLGK
ncbi:MAG: Mfa1 family fimbria major subunit [Tannerellaceae bacterium]|nr:Mfa1 family fimbria major subunit [Tannerellaceae bacterium]